MVSDPSKRGGFFVVFKHIGRGTGNNMGEILNFIIYAYPRTRLS